MFPTLINVKRFQHGLILFKTYTNRYIAFLSFYFVCYIEKKCWITFCLLAADSGLDIVKLNS